MDKESRNHAQHLTYAKKLENVIYVIHIINCLINTYVHKLHMFLLKKF